MNLSFSAPSKTFLSGEYAVLAGGPALIINTSPRFELRAKTGPGQVSGRVLGIPEKSPAARWLYHRSPIVEKWDIEFIDPHEGQGGFGASGAQFLFVHALTTFLQSSVSQAASAGALSLKDICHDLRVLSDGKGSGADVIAQALGGVALVNVKVSGGEARPWPFSDLSFAIVRTGHKTATHDHVASLDVEKLQPLVPRAIACAESYTSGNTDAFVKSVNDYSQALRNINLQAPTTLDLIKKIEKQSWCLAAKGCGALGADTVLLLFHPGRRADVEKYISSLGLPPGLGPDEISGGMDMKWSWDEN